MKTRFSSTLLILILLQFSTQNTSALAAEDFTPAFIGRPTASGPTLNGAIDISNGSQTVYRTTYSREVWTGDIEARLIDKNGKISATAAPPGWKSPATRLKETDWEMNEGVAQYVGLKSNLNKYITENDAITQLRGGTEYFYSLGALQLFAIDFA